MQQNSKSVLTTSSMEQHRLAEDEESFNFSELYLKYIRFWPYFIASAIFAMATAFLINKHTPPVYKIESKFLIKDDAQNLRLFEFSGFGEGALGPKTQKLSNESYKLKSRPIARTTLSKLDFDVEYYREDLFTKTEIYKKTPVLVEVDWKSSQITNGALKIVWNDTQHYQLQFLDQYYKLVTPGIDEKAKTIETPIIENDKFLFGHWAELPFMKLKVNLTGYESEGSIVVVIKDLESLVSQFTGENLEIAPLDKTSSILSLILKHNHPVKGRDYLNKLMEVFLETELNEKTQIASNTISFIDSQISGLSDTLVFIETRLERFRSRNRIYNMSNESGTIFEQLSVLETKLSQEKFKKEYYQNLQDYLAKEEYGEIIIPSGIGIEDPIINTLIENLISLQSEKSRLLATQTLASPTVREVSRKLTDLNASLKEVLRNVDRNSGMMIQDLEDRISKIDQDFARLPQTEQNLIRIQREFTINESIYTFLLQKRAEAVISKASATAANKIIEEALPNFNPQKLKPMLNFIFALILGLLIPFILITFIIFTDVKIKDINELEKKLSPPILGQIGKNKLNNTLIVMKEKRSGITEAFRSLRSNINFTFPTDNQVTILITSTVSGEGKTFCAINLASVYAISDKKTILVGCDLRKPKIFEEFNLNNKKGLSTFLSNQSNDLDSLIQPSPYSNLHLLLAGPIPPNPSELLINERFVKLMEILKQKYDVVILDSPPIGITSETLELVRHSDLTLYILRYNYSRKNFTDKINSLYLQKNLKKTYVVLNGIDKKDLEYNGYGYGYYSEDKIKSNGLKKLFKKSTNRNSKTKNV
jgi:tyrosine-protein kinase Etk/Wzc